MRLLARMLPLVLVGAAVASVPACGDDDGAAADAAPPPDQAAQPDAPPTIAPLLVRGTFIAENTTNGATGANVMVWCDITITRDGQPINNAIVKVNPAIPSLQTFLPGDALNPNHYRGSYNGYFETAKLTVTVDGVEEVPETLLRGPKLYVVEQPAPDAIVPAGMALPVSWGLPGGAVTTADVALQSTAPGYTSTMEADDGSSSIPGGNLVIGNPDDKVIITRWRDNPIASGAATSGIGFGVRSYQPFHVN